MPQSTVIDGKVLDYKYTKATDFSYNFYIGDTHIGQIFKLGRNKWSAISFNKIKGSMGGFGSRYSASEYLLKLNNTRNKKDIYQVHHCFFINTNIINRYEYIIATDTDDARKIYISKYKSGLNLEDEVYALKVNVDTINNEIFHCIELIEMWKTEIVDVRVNDHQRNIIIKRQENLIKKYNELIFNYNNQV